MLPVEITTEKSPEHDMGNFSESVEEATEVVEDQVGTPENSGDTAENVEDNKVPDDKVLPLPPTSPTSQSLWRPKTGLNKRPPGFQAQLCCTCEMTGSPVPLCYLTMSSAFGM